MIEVMWLPALHVLDKEIYVEFWILGLRIRGLYKILGEETFGHVAWLLQFEEHHSQIESLSVQIRP